MRICAMPGTAGVKEPASLLRYCPLRKRVFGLDLGFAMTASGRRQGISLKRTIGSALSNINRQRFSNDRSGVAAVEFALVAMPFFALLFAVLQTALIFFAGQVLESGVSEAARMIRTGQAQAQGFDQAKFKQEVCDHIFGLISCNASLNLDVRTYPSFDQVKTTKYENGEFVEDYKYQPGVGGDIVVVRAFFEWPIIMPLMGVNQGDMDNGNLLLASAIVFRNEPF